MRVVIKESKQARVRQFRSRASWPTDRESAVLYQLDRSSCLCSCMKHLAPLTTPPASRRSFSSAVKNTVPSQIIDVKTLKLKFKKT